MRCVALRCVVSYVVCVVLRGAVLCERCSVCCVVLRRIMCGVALCAVLCCAVL